MPSPYLSWPSYQAKAAPVLTLWARLASLSLGVELASLFAVSLLMWGNRSAHSLTRWAGVKCPNASLTNVLPLNDISNTFALWTCPEQVSSYSWICPAGSVAVVKRCILLELQNISGKEFSWVVYKRQKASWWRMLMTWLHGTPTSLCSITFAFRCILRQLGNECWHEGTSRDSCLCINLNEYFHINRPLCLDFTFN